MTQVIDHKKEFERQLLALKTVPVYKWYKECWLCHAIVPIVSYGFLVGYNWKIGDVPKLDALLRSSYPFVQKIYSKTMGEYVTANTCSRCGALQGNWFVRDDMLTLDEKDRVVDRRLPNNLTIQDFDFYQEDLEPFDEVIPKAAHVHHKDRDPDNNTMSNLVLLCASCHQEVHRR